jgi:hypothetical protein
MTRTPRCTRDHPRGGMGAEPRRGVKFIALIAADGDPPRPVGIGKTAGRRASSVGPVDLASLIAIEVHAHAEISSDGHTSLSPELEAAKARYFKSGNPHPTIDEMARVPHRPDWDRSRPARRRGNPAQVFEPAGPRRRGRRLPRPATRGEHAGREGRDQAGEGAGARAFKPGLCGLPQAGELTPANRLSSRDRTRTYNLPVNSRTLCRLSYAGPCGSDVLDQSTSLPRPQD